MTKSRYLPPNTLETYLDALPHTFKTTVIGKSHNGLPIKQICLGTGKKRIFMWSQMHGNESTTTKAICDLLLYCSQNIMNVFLKTVTLYIIPQLNPDGALKYTRKNANNIDLNRDAISMEASESKVLRTAFNKIQPDYCFNLHGQRTIYAAGTKGKTATLSFLAPAADQKRSITPARKVAMQLIVSMFETLQPDLSGQIARYDDAFNPNCVGDSFTLEGVPTILFEAGHFPDDYQREKTRTFLFKALLKVISAIADCSYSVYKTKDYFDIPENTIDFVDIIVGPVNIIDQEKLYKNQELALQYQEVLINNEIIFKPNFHSYGDKLNLQTHHFIDHNSKSHVLTISYKKDNILDNRLIRELFLKIPSF